MKAQQILSSISIIQKLTKCKLPFKKAYKIYSLVKYINEQRDFLAQEEMKIINKYNAEVIEDGKLQFKNSQDQFNFVQEHNELMQTELEDFNPVDLNLDDLGEEQFTPQELMLLEGVINFID